jgi:CRP-like cAMP-binding protein
MASLAYGLNRLLSAMPDSTLQRWSSQLQPVQMPRGMVVNEPGRTVHHVYFPTTAVVSLLRVLEDGDMAEIAIVGREGVVGISSFMGGGYSSSRGVVQAAGGALRLSSSALLEEFDRCGPAMHLLLRYTHASDRADDADGGVQPPPHDRAAAVSVAASEPGPPRWRRRRGDAGADRQPAGRAARGVTTAAARLQRGGFIRYARGRITVLDREAVQRRSCECYAAVRCEYERLLPSTVAA